MKTSKTFSAMLLILFAGLLQGQEGYYNTSNKEAMKKLSHLTGNWKGEGWIISQQTRQKESFTQEEQIFYRLDSTLIEVHGIGIRDGEIVHDALAIISNKPEGAYAMNSFVGDGRTGDFELSKEGDLLVWKIPVEGGTIRYSMAVSEDTWVEKGDYGSNGNWYPFFEMNLKKQSGE